MCRYETLLIVSDHSEQLYFCLPTRQRLVSSERILSHACDKACSGFAENTTPYLILTESTLSQIKSSADRTLDSRTAEGVRHVVKIKRRFKLPTINYQMNTDKKKPFRYCVNCFYTVLHNTSSMWGFS